MRFALVLLYAATAGCAATPPTATSSTQSGGNDTPHVGTANGDDAPSLDAQGKPLPPASLELRFPSPVRLGPEPPSYEITLRNTSRRPLWVNTVMRMLSASPPGLGEGGLEIEGASGEGVESGCKVNRGFAKPERYSVLEPGASISTKHSLRCYELKPGSTYRARAYFLDENPKAPPGPRGTRLLTERVQSAWVAFRVESN